MRGETYVPFSVVVMVIVLFMVGLFLMGQQYANLRAEVRTACAETGAAAKLDLSSFVPVCLRVK